MTGEPLTFFGVGGRVMAGTTSGAVWRDDNTGETRELVVTGSRPFKGGLLVMFDSINDRAEAERWRDRRLLVPESELSAPGEGEIYLRELETMRVCDESGVEVGTVSAWYEVPSGILLDVKNGLREATVPFNAHFVRNVDRAARTLTIAIPDELWQMGKASP